MMFEGLPTPCYVVDEGRIRHNLEILQQLEKDTGCHVLLAQKAFSMYSLYPMIGRYISGTTASGLYEARLGYEEMGKENHVFAPAYKEADMQELVTICDHIIFNSFAQYEKYKDICQANGVSVGIRVNPQCSTQEGHDIYDPCGYASRLGVTKAQFPEVLPEGIEGLHFHTLCEQNADDLVTTFQAFEEKFGKYLHCIKWLNLGGGHHITRKDYQYETLVKLIRYIRETYHVTVYLEPIPNIFKFMARSNEIVSDFSGDTVYDLFIAQDCGDTGRLGGAAHFFEQAKHTVCVDHHISNQSFAQDNYIFPQASSASELVYELLPKERITKEIAECIYTGMVHDTGVFQYSCTSRKTMEIAGALMECGINYPKIVDDTFYTKTYNQNRIMGLALLKSRLHLNGKCISSVITEEEMKQYDVLPKHLDGIVNQLRVTKDVEVAVFLYETGDGTFKVSTRSREVADVSKVAVKYGGGGHIRAAGFSMTGDADAIIEQIVSDLAEQIK